MATDLENELIYRTYAEQVKRGTYMVRVGTKANVFGEPGMLVNPAVLRDTSLVVLAAALASGQLTSKQWVMP